MSETPYNQLKERLFDLNALNASMAIMDWDQQTYMPEGGAEARSRHLSSLARMAHEIMVADETGNLIQAAGTNANSLEEKAFLRNVQREFDLKTKIPAALVAKKAGLAAVAHEDWVKARANNDFKSFAPTLETMFDIAREEAEHLGYKDHIYDALTDQYEEGLTAADWRIMFDSIKPQAELIKAILAQPEVNDKPLYGDWDLAKQKEFTEEIVKAIGFDFHRGRQDTAPHPFCTGWSVNDIRLTTRFKPYIGSAIFGSLHEAGHGMYEQGSPEAWDLTPLAGGVSLGIHESQSRTWENIVGRSKAFWSLYLPRLQQLFPALAGIGVDDFYRMINKVAQSYIRVEADELTYNMHVMVRFEIECEVLTGALAVKDMPEAWNAKYEQYLGIRPKTDSEGCLQDVHWSMGSIGYFPTYSMGNILSYQIWNSLEKDVKNPFDQIAEGNFGEILGWLQSKIYSKGKLHTPKELIQAATGEPMNAKYYLEGLGAKYRELYGI